MWTGFYNTHDNIDRFVRAHFRLLRLSRGRAFARSAPSRGLDRPISHKRERERERGRTIGRVTTTASAGACRLFFLGDASSSSSSWSGVVTGGAGALRFLDRVSTVVIKARGRGVGGGGGGAGPGALRVRVPWRGGLGQWTWRWQCGLGRRRQWRCSSLAVQALGARGQMVSSIDVDVLKTKRRQT